jgi:hypothetical protein
MALKSIYIITATFRTYSPFGTIPRNITTMTLISKSPWTNYMNSLRRKKSFPENTHFSLLSSRKKFTGPLLDTFELNFMTPPRPLSRSLSRQWEGLARLLC